MTHRFTPTPARRQRRDGRMAVDATSLGFILTSAVCPSYRCFRTNVERNDQPMDMQRQDTGASTTDRSGRTHTILVRAIYVHRKPCLNDCCLCGLNFPIHYAIKPSQLRSECAPRAYAEPQAAVLCWFSWPCSGPIGGTTTNLGTSERPLRVLLRSSSFSTCLWTSWTSSGP